jgi:CRISP-associated protein Cas1
MKRSYYLFNPGRLSRKDNTLKFQPIDENGNEGQAKYLPIETIDNLYCFGSLDANSTMYSFLGQNQIAVHFFDYYEHYTGSFMPKDYLLAGKMQIDQTKAYLDKKKRHHLALGFVEGAAANMIRNLKYYSARDKEVGDQILRMEALLNSILKNKKTNHFDEKPSYHIPELMGIEGNIKQEYYSAFEQIIPEFEMGNRVKNPPSNEINCMISFCNTLCYTTTLDAIYHTQLNPTISFLHEPGYRRYSLALDIAEVFKPILADRMIFKLLNRKEIQARHFEKGMNGCLLTKEGRQIVVKEFEERRSETIQHRTLKRQVSFKGLIKLECYKISKYILGIEPEYVPFKIWW